MLRANEGQAPNFQPHHPFNHTIRGFLSMKTLTKLIVPTVLLGLAVTGHASATQVLGVTWDPNAGGATPDFTGQHQFTQWYSEPTSVSANLVQGDINGTPLQSDAIDPTTIVVGDVLVGTGVFIGINGQAPYSPPASDPFCGDPASCELTFVLGGFEVIGFESGIPLFSGGWANLYSDQAVGPFYNGTDGETPAEAADGSLFLSLEAQSFPNSNGTATTLNFTSGTILTAGVEAFLNATAGAALANFDTNSQLFGSDVRYEGNASFVDSQNVLRFISQSGNGQTFSDTVENVPAPSVVALMSIGLLGIGYTGRRRSSKTH